MTVAAAALTALPASLLTIWLLLRTPAARIVVAAPRADRWHKRSTPLLGGSGIMAGLLVAVGVALAAGLIPASRELAGILAGCAILFVAGLLDDIYRLSPLAKIAAQVAAAVVVLAAGIRVEIISNDIAGHRARPRLADRDDERVQPARQHGRPGGDARRDRLRLLRHRRVHDPPEQHRRGALARHLLRVHRLPAGTTSA